MDFQNIATAVVTSGIVSSLATLGMQTFLKQGITHHFNKELALFNAKIAVEADNRRLDFDRKIHDFSLYSKKRHEIYPELFKRIYKIYNDLSRVKSAARASSISDVDYAVKHLELLGFDLKEDVIVKLRTFYDKWNDNLATRQQNSKIYIEMQLLREIGDSLKKSEAFFLENIIYFSDSATEKTKILFEVLITLFQYQSKSGQDSPKICEKFSEENFLQSVHKTVIELQQIIRQELAVGDYS